MVDLVCGTGDWSGPKPGDPSNNSILSAVPAYGGVDITISYPTLNPHAVAHVRLFRGLTNNLAGARLLAIFSGDFYHDRSTLDIPPLYYYWVEIVSVNGTIGEPIGPASARARPTIEQTIEMLTGKIDAGVLAQSLKTELDKITHLQEGLTQESQFRANGEIATGSAFEGLRASVEGMESQVLQEMLVLTQANSSLAQAITTVQSSLGDDLATVSTQLQTNITTVAGKVTEIGALYTAKLSVNGLIGGFGIYNDGSEVEAGFDVDRFWIGRTNANKRKPFIIDGGVVYIDDAAINKLTFNKLRDESGSFIVEGGKVKAQYLKVSSASIDDLAVTNAKVGGDLWSKNWTGWGGAGWYVTQSGTAYFNNAYIRGHLEAATGTFSGTLTASAINAVNTINIAGNAVTTANSWNFPLSVTENWGVSFVYQTLSIYLPTGGDILLVANIRSSGHNYFPVGYGFAFAVEAVVDGVARGWASGAPSELYADGSGQMTRSAYYDAALTHVITGRPAGTTTIQLRISGTTRGGLQGSAMLLTRYR